jgi:hypothetical protein
MIKLDYKKMLEKIDALVCTDFCADMDWKTTPKTKPFTQKESEQMAQLLGRVYSISHCIHCTACQSKFLNKM